MMDELVHYKPIAEAISLLLFPHAEVILHNLKTGRIAAIFNNDWREKINIYVSSYLKQHALRLKSLDKDEKKKLLLALHKEGAFNTKNAASYVADVLQISRATVYNYLKDKP